MPPIPPPRQLAALCAVADALARPGVRGLLAGSAGRARLGCPARPADIDIEVAPQHAEDAAAALGVVLAEAGGGGRSSRRGHASRAGVEIDVTCELVVDGPHERLGPDFALQWEWSHPVDVCGRAVRVAPLEESLCRAVVAGDWAGAETLADQAARAGAGIRLSAAYVAARLSSATARAAR